MYSKCIYILLIVLFLMPCVVIACPYERGQLVRITFTNVSGHPIDNANVSVRTSLPEARWIFLFLGINYPETIDVNPTHVKTDNDGVVILTMYDTLKYNITISKGNLIQSTHYIIPRDINDYKIIIEGDE